MSDRDQWLAERRTGIGGSDAGAILGVNKYRTALDVYLDKTGQAEDQVENDAMYWGTVLEDIVAQEYTKRSGNKIQRDNKMLRHKDYGFILANLDRRIVGQNAILECKTAARENDWGEPGTDEVPESYLAQVMHYMAVTGADYADVAVLFRGSKFAIYTVQRDEELIEHIINMEKMFWQNYVEKNTPPDAASLRDLSNRWRQDNGKSIQADMELFGMVDRLRDMKKEKSELEDQMRILEFGIKEKMQDNTEVLNADGNKICTWKTRASSRFDTKRFREEYPDLAKEFTNQSTTRTFLIK